MKVFLAVLLLSALPTVYAQNGDLEKSDSNFWIGINLHHQIPAFQYLNNEIKNGVFEQQILHEDEAFTIQGSFKEFKSDGLWVAIDSFGTARLLALFHSDTISFLHLNDTLGRPAHHITYGNNKKLTSEWYYNGRLVQYDEYVQNGRINTAFREDLKHRLTIYVDKDGRGYKKILYDDNGALIKETTNVNE